MKQAVDESQNNEVEILVSDKDRQRIAGRAADRLPDRSQTAEEIAIAEQVRQRLEDRHI